MNKDLYVKNISFDATEDDLRKLFTLMGKVTYIHMVTDPKSGNFLGCAYVKMENEAQAKEALTNLDGTLLCHRIISVEEALPQRPKEFKPKKYYQSNKGPKSESRVKTERPVRNRSGASKGPRGKTK